jgi:purine nucleoside permease
VTQIAERRRQFEPVATAHLPPRVLRGDEISSTTFWHGTLLSARARAWVEYQTDGRGTYAITAMEDAGTLQALTLLAAAGRIDLARVLIVRAVSNFDQQRPGITAAESLVESRVTTYSAYVPALENAHRVGHRVLQALLAAWPHSPA